MAIARLRHTSYSSNGSVTRANWFSSNRNPEDAASINSCAYMVASGYTSPDISLLNFPAFNKSGKNITSIKLKYKARQVYSYNSGSGRYDGTANIVNTNSGVTIVTSTIGSSSDYSTYMNSSEYVTVNIPEQYWDLICSGSGWKVRLNGGWSGGTGNTTTYCSAAVIDIEYTPESHIEIGTSLLKKAKLGANKIKKILTGTTVLFRDLLIPKEYQQIEYVYFNGTNSGSSSSPYIDTGITPSASKGFYIDMDAIGASGCTGWGTGVNGAATIFRGSTTGMRLQCDNSSQARTVSVVGRHTWVIDYYNQKDGYDTTLGDISVSQYATINFYLGGWHEGNSVYYGLKGKVYNFKVYDNGILIADYIPCYRKEDDVIGFYDLATGTFKTNSGSGAFSKGPEVDYVLPSTYQEVQYIQSDGNQYIDTGISSSSAIAEWQIKFDPLGSYAHNYEQYLAGDRSAGAQGGKLYYAGGTIRYQGTPIGSGNELSMCDYNIGAVELGMTTRDGVTCNGTVKSTYPGGVWGSLTFWVFNSHSETSLGASMRLYYLKMYSDAVLVRNFIPCYRKSDNVIGLYDTVSKTFFTNSGSGSFTKGNNIY